MVVGNTVNRTINVYTVLVYNTFESLIPIGISKSACAVARVYLYTLATARSLFSRTLASPELFSAVVPLSVMI